MVEIVGTRGTGTSDEQVITDPLVTTLSVAMSRVTAELDEKAAATEEITLTCVPLFGVKVGQLVRVEVPGDVPWTAKVTSVSHRKGAGPEMVTVLTVVRPDI